MDTSTYKSRIALTQSYKINNFVENICQEHNISNYYGAISVSIERIIELINSFYGNEYENKYITFCFEYKKHKVYYHIYEHKIEYYIDSPEKYDNLDINKEHEKISMINISINDFNSLEIFLNSLVDIYHKNIDSIDKFEDEVDAFIIDKKTMDEILDYKDFNKSMNIFLNVICLVIVLPMGVALTFCLIKEFNSIIEQDGLAQTIIGIIALAFLDIFFVFSYIIC